MRFLHEKREKEKSIVNLMIKTYCKKKHSTESICKECQDLSTYTYFKIDRCPHIAEKTFCSSCPTQCYNEKYRRKIKNVMKFSGPRILLYHPILVIKYFLDKHFNLKG